MLNKKQHTAHRANVWALVILTVMATLALTACRRDEKKDDTPGKPQAVNFCNDALAWAAWHDYYEKYKFDDDMAALYGMRIGLCNMVMQDRIELERAERIVQERHEALIKRWSVKWKPFIQQLRERAARRDADKAETKEPAKAPAVPAGPKQAEH